MSSAPSVRRALKRLVENPKASCKARLRALARLQGLGVPVAMLERLMRDKKLPARLLAAVLEAYEVKRTIHKWKKDREAAAGTLGKESNITGVLGSR